MIDVREEPLSISSRKEWGEGSPATIGHAFVECGLEDYLRAR